MKEVILIGYFDETVELCQKCGYSIAGYVDSSPKGPYTYLGNDSEFIAKHSRYLGIPLVITPDNPVGRSTLYKKYNDLGFAFQTLIAPDAIISKTATISDGCMIQSLCNVSSNTVLGKCVRLNTGANIMHDIHVGDFSVVAPSAVVLGQVHIGSKVYIGANSTILPHLEIGEGATIGAGAVVTKNVLNRAVVAGVPARMLRRI